MAKSIDWHGTINGYQHYKCRCEACRLAKREYRKKYYVENTQKVLKQNKQYYEQNREQLLKYKQKYYQDNHDHLTEMGRKRSKEFGKIDRERNRERIYETHKQWRLINKETRAAYLRNWRKTSKGELSVRLDQNKRRAVPLDDISLEWTLILSGDPCCYCGKIGKTIDHIIPVSRGGKSDWDNLSSSCQSCNSRKREKSLLLFMFGRNCA